MKIKHSKYKNTGLVFELLVKQVAADTLSRKDSPAVDISKSTTQVILRLPKNLNYMNSLVKIVVYLRVKQKLLFLLLLKFQENYKQNL